MVCDDLHARLPVGNSHRAPLLTADALRGSLPRRMLRQYVLPKLCFWSNQGYAGTLLGFATSNSTATTVPIFGPGACDNVQSRSANGAAKAQLGGAAAGTQAGFGVVMVDPRGQVTNVGACQKHSMGGSVSKAIALQSQAMLRTYSIVGQDCCSMAKLFLSSKQPLCHPHVISIFFANPDAITKLTPD